jgi:hypothetical protein
MPLSSSELFLEAWRRAKDFELAPQYNKRCHKSFPEEKAEE